MTQGLRALATTLGAEQEARARSLAEASARYDRARESRAVAEAAEAAIVTRVQQAASERGATAAERALADAHRARLRDALAAARERTRAAREAEAQAARSLDAARGALLSVHGEQRAVEGRIDQRAAETALRRARREEDDPLDR
ncbi:MAG: hypothetical protein U0234_22270 [Sandaracinus sp.]